MWKIANAVIVARQLGATLVMPTIKEGLTELARYELLDLLILIYISKHHLDDNELLQDNIPL